MVLIEEQDNILKKFSLKEWLLVELIEFESKYGMKTEEFVNKWNSRGIPEPEDQKLLEKFLEWEGLFLSLQNVENELKEIENRIKES